MNSDAKQRSRGTLPVGLGPEVKEFLNSISLMVRVVGPGGSSNWFNGAWLTFTGRTLDEQTDARWLDDVHPDDRDLVLQAGATPSELGQQSHVRFRLRRKDGEYRLVACTKTPRYRAGEFLGCVHSCLDVQDLLADREYRDIEQLLSKSNAQLSLEREKAGVAHSDAILGRAREKHANKARVQSERQFQLLVQGITDYAVFLLDPEGRITTWNPGAQRIKGYDAEEIIGRHFSIFYTDEDRAAGAPQRVLETAAREGRFEAESWRVRKNGQRFWAHVVLDSIRDEHGNLVGFAKITRDLSDRRAAEIQSRQLRLLIEGVKDYAIFLLDRDGRVSTWNAGAERIEGYAAGEIIGRHFSVFYTEEDRAAGIPQQSLDAAAQEGRFETENWRVRNDGSRFWANVVIDAIRDNRGQLVGFAKITRDLTERKNAQEELTKAREQLFQLQKMEAIGQLTGGVAHDFNNLLTIIIGNVDMAHRALSDSKPGGEDKARRLLGNALAGAKRAANLTQRLLAFARRQPLDPKPIDVVRFIATVGDFLTRTLGEDIHIEAVTGGSLWKIEADPTQLESAILNIALNARDAMPQGGKLTIEAVNTNLDDAYVRFNPEIAPGQYVAISVTDTGTGMSPEVMARVFEPFFTTKTMGQGTGLGLAQVYGFVRQSGGNVKIYSEPGEGTMVKIYLPRLIMKGVSEEAAPLESVLGAGGETVLVVEDDPAVLEYVTEVLVGLNYQVLQANEGTAAVKILQADACRIDLLLTDVIMPGISGRVVAEEAKRLNPGIKILFMTGYSQNAIVHQGRLDQGVHLIQKPVTPPELANRIRNLLDHPATNS